MGWLTAPGTFGLLAEYFLKGTLVLTLALLAAAASKRRPAAFRHFLLSFALIGLLLLPLLSLAPVGWRTSLLPSRPAAAEKQVREFGGPGGKAAAGPDVMLAFSANEPAGLVDLQFTPRTEASASPSPSSTRPFPTSEGRANSRDWGGLLDLTAATLWSAGLLLLILRLSFGLAGAVKLTKEGTTLGDPVWRVLFERFRSLVSLRRKISLKSHPEVLVPLTWGWKKPVILMPAGAEDWTEGERSSALFHELSHIKRADFLVMLLVRTSLAVFWFNPFCWIVYRELRKEQEIACDELVLRTGIRPSTYAASLLAFRRSAGFRWNPSAALLGMLGGSMFHSRLAAILRQQLTFKEVKMKTKIMLAATIILAVALVGTARPATGSGNASAAPTVVQAASPAAASIVAAQPAAEAREKQTEKTVVQEKEKEKAKAAEQEKTVIEKKIVVTTKGGVKTPIEITFTEGGVVKTLTLDKPLTITSAKDGHVLVLTSEGKEIQVLKGEALRLEIKGGSLELIKEGKALKIGEGGAYYKILKEGDKDGSTIVYDVTPEGKASAAQKLQFVKEGEAEKGVKVVVGTAKEGDQTITWTVKEPGKDTKSTIAWTVTEPGKDGAAWIAKEYSGKPFTGTWMSKDGKPLNFAVVGNQEILDKVREIREQVAAVKEKKLDIAELEKTLEKLEAELKAKEEKLQQLTLKFEAAPGEVKVVKEIREGEAEGVAKDKIAYYVTEGAPKNIARIIGTNDGTIQIILTGIEGGPERKPDAVAAAAVERLKKELPEGYKVLDSNFDKKAGTLTIKFASPAGKTPDKDLVRKLVESLKEEIKKK